MKLTRLKKIIKILIPIFLGIFGGFALVEYLNFKRLKMQKYYIGYCPYCKEEKELKYNGTLLINKDRQNPKFKDYLDKHLLTCNICYDTFSIDNSKLKKMILKE